MTEQLFDDTPAHPRPSTQPEEGIDEQRELVGLGTYQASPPIHHVPETLHLVARIHFFVYPESMSP